MNSLTRQLAGFGHGTFVGFLYLALRHTQQTATTTIADAAVAGTEVTGPR